MLQKVKTSSKSTLLTHAKTEKFSKLFDISLSLTLIES